MRSQNGLTKPLHKTLIAHAQEFGLKFDEQQMVVVPWSL